MAQTFESPGKMQTLTAVIKPDAAFPGLVSFKPTVPIRNATRVWVSEIRLVLPAATPKPILTLKEETGSIQATDLNSLGRISLAPDWDPVMLTLTSRWSHPGQLFSTRDNRNSPIDQIRLTFCDVNGDPVAFTDCLIRLLVEYTDHPSSNHPDDNFVQMRGNRIGIPAMSLPY